MDTTSPVPPYEQIRAQLAHLITQGALPARERLPPVRQLAADLGLAVGTVARAYRELELAGLVTSRRGGGTRVADMVRPAPAQHPVEQLATAYVTAARRLGASDDQVLTAVHKMLQAG
ncbi:GntR family transcriptional regulator [Actinoplanes palleronii]|uniref:GntR family transcriptional regulator n=1 Tax=Actinoplanes palleronii TaxID=113570 RepID=A0ABQ4B5U4_9ACTN|nr:GntR family transcriptional regulator [Actinoplanes palleronii]